MSAWRFVPLLVGVGLILFGLFLVSSHGTVAGVYLPTLVGFPNCNAQPNSTQCAAFTYAGYSVGAFVALFGIGIAARGARYAIPRSRPGAGGGSTSPGAPATSSTTSAALTGSVGPVRYCSRCGRPNAEDASFCQRCGAAMPPSV